MKGDFARVTFDAVAHFSQVMQQQGRVLLEADWNEQNAINLHLLRTLATDLAGACWVAGPTGFSITTKSGNGDLPLADWILTPGRLYVDGILCENDTHIVLKQQPYLPIAENDELERELARVPEPFFLWVDVWERHVSWLEAPTLNDPALNGVDTASRVQVIWQVRVANIDDVRAILENLKAALTTQRNAPGVTDAEARGLDSLINALEQIMETRLDQVFDRIGGEPPDTEDDYEEVCAMLRSLITVTRDYAGPMLKARVEPRESNDDPCLIAADARYRGCENQLYRVEIHDPGLPSSDEPTGATFKWSRENASVIFGILGPLKTLATNDDMGRLSVTLQSLGRDQRLGIAVGDWVELIDDACTLRQRAAPLLQVLAVDVPNRTVTLAVPPGVTPMIPSAEPGMHPILRRWDHDPRTNARGVIAVREGEWIDLEDGVQVWFKPGAVYSHGDYWTIPARVPTADVLWPQGTGATAGPLARKASGGHHKAVLGGANAQGVWRECVCRYINPCDQRLMDQAGRVRGGKMALLGESTADGVAPKKKKSAKNR